MTNSEKDKTKRILDSLEELNEREIFYLNILCIILTQLSIFILMQVFIIVSQSAFSEYIKVIVLIFSILLITLLDCVIIVQAGFFCLYRRDSFKFPINLKQNRRSILDSFKKLNVRETFYLTIFSIILTILQAVSFCFDQSNKSKITVSSKKNRRRILDSFKKLNVFEIFCITILSTILIQCSIMAVVKVYVVLILLGQTTLSVYGQVVLLVFCVLPLALIIFFIIVQVAFFCLDQRSKK